MRTIQNMVNWPAVDYDTDAPISTTGEQMYVYAFWEEPERSNAVLSEAPEVPFEDVLVRAVGPLAEKFKLRNDGRYSMRISAALLLGDSITAFYDNWRGEYWSADSVDLTDEGRTILTALEQVYGPATIVTYLDT